MPHRAIAMLLVFGLAGCVGAPSTYGEFVQSTYSPTEFGFGAARRDLWTQFRGDPFGLGDEAFQAEGDRDTGSSSAQATANELHD